MALKSYARAVQLGDSIDAFWRALGLDFEGYAKRSPAKARAIGVWLLAVGVTIGYGCLYYVFATLLLSWDLAFGWGKEPLTFAFMAAILTGAAVSPFVGRAVDAGRSRWVLSGGMALGALGLVLLGSAQNYPMFFLAWLMLGVAQGSCLYEPTFAFVTRVTGAEAARFITRITLVAGFASTLAFPAGTALAEAFGWRVSTFAFAAVAGLIGAPLAFSGASLLECCPEARTSLEGRSKDRSALRVALRRPVFWLIFLAFPLVGLAEGLVLTHIIPILTSQGLSLGKAVLVSSLFGPMQVAGRLAMMGLRGRVRVLVVAVLAVSSVFGSIVLLMQVQALPNAAFGFAVLFGAGYGLISILKPVVAAEVLGRKGFGSIAGVLAVPFLVALALSPYLGASLERVGGYPLALNAAAGVAALSILLLLALNLAVRRGKPLA